MSHAETQEELRRQLDKYPNLALDLDQVAEVLNISRRTVDKLVDEGKLKAFAVDPAAKSQNKRVTKADLMAFMLNNKIN